MSHRGFYQGDATNGFESERICVIQRCYTQAEFECPTCLKRYCDEHYRIHHHYDVTSSKDLR